MDSLSGAKPKILPKPKPFQSEKLVQTNDRNGRSRKVNDNEAQN